MIKLKQYLEEGRDAPLYHGTSVARAASIIEDNKLVGKTNHTIINNYKKNIIKGVSLSRDFKASVYLVFHEFDHNSCVVFEFDQRKLTQRHSVKPLNYYHTTYPELNGRPTKGLGARRMDSRMHRGEMNNESEEFLVGDIKNVSNYIVKIHVCSDLTKQHIDKSYPELAKHPKLWYAERTGTKGYFYNDKS
jgi:hypothetical protein